MLRRVSSNEGTGMVRTAVLVGAIAWTLSCSGDDASPKGQYGEQCSGGDCVTGLNCVPFPSGNGICTLHCQSTAECRANVNPSAVCQGGNCYDPCTDSSRCAAGLQCGNLAGSTQMICRP